MWPFRKRVVIHTGKPYRRPTTTCPGCGSRDIGGPSAPQMTWPKYKRDGLIHAKCEQCACRFTCLPATIDAIQAREPKRTVKR